MKGMMGIPRTRNDENVRSNTARTFNHLVDVALELNCNDDASRLLQPTFFEKPQI